MCPLLLAHIFVPPPPLPLQLYMHYFVKRLLSRAMDRSNREREMASVCLSNLYADVGGRSCPPI